MPIPLKLGVSFTPEEITAISEAAQLIIDTINNKMVLNLSTEERKSLSKISDNRFTYVARSISEYAVDFPQLNGIGYALADANNDLKTFANLGGVLTLIAEAQERVTEMQMVAGHFMFGFATDQYANAERYKNKNVTGADTVYNAMKDMFEGQGPQQPAPPAP